ncbi:unnamed protein product [Rotaria magnacalcarata]|uniref:Uncharacterized protein n=1 Tax=Rotaria magnacalcarata TaxID=392030 RepID=A0A820NBH0_9BILA|nr:unnamed protein product [Rotaria magnacalcarata]CAF4384666.1 unnamed protein product [Rotaria magnacalcarata]
MNSSSSSSCPLGLAPAGANHLRDQIFPCPSILRKISPACLAAVLVSSVCCWSELTSSSIRCSVSPDPLLARDM